MDKKHAFMRAISLYLLFSSLVWTASGTQPWVGIIPQTKLIASDGASDDYFGHSVSIDGDYAIVGAYQDDDMGDDSGAAYILKRDGANWSQQVKLTASDGAAGDSFGFSVSIDGDYAIVGAYEDDDKGGRSGSAYIFKRDGTNWLEQAKLTASDGTSSDYFGSSVSIDGGYVIIGAYADKNRSGSAYIFKRDGTNWHEQTKLTASDGSALDSFGVSVSIDGDYAVIGARHDDDKGSCSGSAYIFKRNDTNWHEQVKLTASDGSEYEFFGCSVSIDGDYAIVAAYKDDDKGDNSGSAYIFKRDGTSWSQQTKLLAADGATDDFFGCSVSIDGDYAIVGAYGDGDKGYYSGSAYVFKRDGANWSQQTKLIASDDAFGDRFGFSVSIDGDYAIIGAHHDDDKGSDSGSAYVFDSSDPLAISAVIPPEDFNPIGVEGGPFDPNIKEYCLANYAVDPLDWTVLSTQPWLNVSPQSGTLAGGASTIVDICIDANAASLPVGLYSDTVTFSNVTSGITKILSVRLTVEIPWGKLLASDGAALDSFGYSVSISGDYAIVGAFQDDDKGHNSGSAYIFKRDGTNWLLQAKLTASDGAAYEQFGVSVSIDGDYTIVGARQGAGKEYGSGSVYIFKRDGSDWQEQAKLTASDGEGGDSFGGSVSIIGDYAIIGASRDDDHGYNSGSAYIFKRNGDNWSQQAKLTASDGFSADRFGWSVSIDGDYAIIGAYRDGDHGYNSGSAYIFKRNGDNWSQQAKLTASDGFSADRFGWSVSIDGDYAIIGAYGDDDNGNQSGSAYVFRRDGSDWQEQPKLTASDGAASDRFGSSVSIDGDYAVVGANGDDDKGTNSGSAYIFKRDGSNWFLRAKLTASDGFPGDYFGDSVSIYGRYAIVGAKYDDDKGNASGSAYIYGPINAPPVADAGDDQTVYAPTNALTDVTLDGTGSYDLDGDPLTYIWKVDGQIISSDGIINMLDYAVIAAQLSDSEDLYMCLTAMEPLFEAWLSTPAWPNWDPNVDVAPTALTGAIITTQLSAGEHIIELIVNDGFDDSEPNYAIVTVIPPVQADVRFIPQNLNCDSHGNYVKAHFTLPEGFIPEDINTNTPVVAEVIGSPWLMQIESVNMNVFINDQGLVCIEAVFVRADFCNILPGYGDAELAIYGRLTTGEYFYDTDTTTTNGSPPTPAYNPSPADGAINVSASTDLSFSAGSNTGSHDVYLGTTNPPPFIGNQTATTFDPGTLNYETTYYWQIDEVGPGGTTIGALWSFTTVAPPPGLAQNPSPADGAIDISIIADLSFSAGSFTTSHDVYFGTTNPPPFISNQTATTFEPGLLDFSTTYYWQIDEVGPSGTTTGQTWTFNTIDPNFVAWWEFDEVSGNTAHDSTGNNHGTVYGAAWTTGQIVGALSFDGDYDYVMVGDKDNLEPQNLTLSFWAQLDNPSGSLQGGIGKGVIFGQTNGYSYQLSFHAGQAIAVITNTSDTGFSVSASIPNSDWHMWTMTAGSGTLRIYRDGYQQGSDIPYVGPIDYDKNHNDFVIGARFGGNFSLDGKIDDVRFYDRVLSALEIQQLYQGNL